MLGTGMSLSGACPGTVWVQVGGWIWTALITLGGGFLGALAFSLLEPHVLKPSGILSVGMFRVPTLDLLLGVPFAPLAAAVGLLFLVISVSLEVIVPWRSELPVAFGAATPVAYAWPPSVAGVVVGLLQLPLLAFVGETLGASRAFVTVWSNIVGIIAPSYVDKKNSYLKGAKSGISNWSQLLFVVFAVAGSAIASQLTWVSGARASDWGAIEGFNVWRSLVGGFLIVFGGRMAGGCTSGQGLSGNAVLALNSPFATAAMFVGGIATAFIIKLF